MDRLGIVTLVHTRYRTRNLRRLLDMLPLRTHARAGIELPYSMED